MGRGPEPRRGSSRPAATLRARRDRIDRGPGFHHLSGPLGEAKGMEEVPRERRSVGTGQVVVGSVEVSGG